LFTQSNLAKLVGPVLPDPISNTRRHGERNDNSEEYAQSGWTVPLSEFVFVAGAGMCDADVKFFAALAGCDGDSAEAGCLVEFFEFGIGFALKEVIWW
jgi:hypothetical protein